MGSHPCYRSIGCVPWGSDGCFSSAERGCCLWVRCILSSLKMRIWTQLIQQRTFFNPGSTTRNDGPPDLLNSSAPSRIFWNECRHSCFCAVETLFSHVSPVSPVGRLSVRSMAHRDSSSSRRNQPDGLLRRGWKRIPRVDRFRYRARPVL